MAKKKQPFRSALRFDFLTAHYDSILDWTMRDIRFKTELVRRADIQAGHRVLDFGCGTGTLSRLVKKTHPQATVLGLDVDPAILRQAREKGDQANLAIDWLEGTIEDHRDRLGNIDRIVSSLVFHHLLDDEKRIISSQMRSLLAPAGEVHLCDFTAPANQLQAALFLSVRLLDGWDRTSANARGRLAEIFRESGFEFAQTESPQSTWAGTIAFTVARI
ncbi:class I SAM-dependent methyltransferase [bacterium]|jgi:cyclopropane fatty-acyl-phospholipid synthase-like methyltransferase|nr:class I SAM-dependent methyltransferase [bacterium]